MSDKRLYLQLSKHCRSSKQVSSKTSMFSNTTIKQHQTHRSQKFIPIQFRDKQKDNPKNKQQYNRSQYFPSAKTPLIIKSKQSFSSNTSDFEQKKFGKPGCFLKQINPDAPKLRQTNSTQCQSPKGNSYMLGSKINDFVKVRMLGKGRFGEVYLVRHVKTGFIAALKVINKLQLLKQTPEEYQKSINQLIRQIKLQSYLNHPNLIKLYDFFSDTNYLYLLMELASDGQLFEFTEKGHKFTQETTSILVRQIVQGVDFMHERQIIHRDLKLENIVLCHGMAKICDFGWSVYCPKQFRNTLCGTPIYLSPQILAGKQYTKKVDIWAIGSITHELFTGQDPFRIKTKQQLNKIIDQDFQMELGSPQLRSFITFILRKNPTKRPDTETIMKHPYIQRYKELDTSEQLCKLIYKLQ